eukprot:365313-Chlamydomonas_euryale.AAC.37
MVLPCPLAQHPRHAPHGAAVPAGSTPPRAALLPALARANKDTRTHRHAPHGAAVPAGSTPPHAALLPALARANKHTLTLRLLVAHWTGLHNITTTHTYARTHGHAQHAADVRAAGAEQQSAARRGQGACQHRDAVAGPARHRQDAHAACAHPGAGRRVVAQRQPQGRARDGACMRRHKRSGRQPARGAGGARHQGKCGSWVGAWEGKEGGAWAVLRPWLDSVSVFVAGAGVLRACGQSEPHLPQPRRAVWCARCMPWLTCRLQRRTSRRDMTPLWYDRHFNSKHQHPQRRPRFLS